MVQPVCARLPPPAFLTFGSFFRLGFHSLLQTNSPFIFCTKIILITPDCRWSWWISRPFRGWKGRCRKQQASPVSRRPCPPKVHMLTSSKQGFRCCCWWSWCRWWCRCWRCQKGWFGCSFRTPPQGKGCSWYVYNFDEASLNQY